MAESAVSHSSKMTEVPHPSETEAPTTTEVTLQTTTEAPAKDDMDVTPLVATKVTAPAST